jgi:hypothetical protein
MIREAIDFGPFFNLCSLEKKRKAHLFASGLTASLAQRNKIEFLLEEHFGTY